MVRFSFFITCRWGRRAFYLGRLVLLDSTPLVKGKAKQSPCPRKQVLQLRRRIGRWTIGVILLWLAPRVVRSFSGSQTLGLKRLCLLALVHRRTTSSLCPCRS